MKEKYHNIIFKNKYFPNKIDMNLLVCSKECAKVWLGPAKFIHICDKCGNHFKRLYTLSYELKNKRILKCKDRYKELFVIEGNKDQNIDWIDDITYEDLISGKVECLQNINEISISLVVCSKECKYTGLIYDGAPQVCPKCGKQTFRVKVKSYKFIK